MLADTLYKLAFIDKADQMWCYAATNIDAMPRAKHQNGIGYITAQKI